MTCHRQVISPINACVLSSASEDVFGEAIGEKKEGNRNRQTCYRGQIDCSRAKDSRPEAEFGRGGGLEKFDLAACGARSTSQMVGKGQAGQGKERRRAADLGLPAILGQIDCSRAKDSRPEAEFGRGGGLDDVPQTGYLSNQRLCSVKRL